MKIDETNIIFLNDTNAVLLQLRDNKPDIPYPNMWALPEGHRDKDETPQQCILREVKEELSLAASRQHTPFPLSSSIISSRQ